MQRLFASALLLVSAASLNAQTIQITTSNGVCTYPTGPVRSDPANPGQLLASATGAAQGPGCGGFSSGPSFGPASPLAPLTQQLASAGGASSALTFQALNATSCTGTISGGSNGTFTNGVVSGAGTASATICNSLAGCAAASFIGTFAANATTSNINNTVSVQCSGSSGAPVSSTATVTVLGTTGGGGGGTCAKIPGTNGVTTFTQLTGNKNTSLGFPNSVDVTSFDAIWGTWPGTSGVVAYFTLPQANYISAAFKSSNNYISNFVPQPPTNSPLVGYYQVGETNPSVPVSMTISTTCGDFSNPTTYGAASTVVPGCWANKRTADGYLAWTKDTVCKLVDSRQYYLNIINADISGVQPLGANNTAGGSAASTFDPNNSHCSVAGCSDPIQNSHN